MYHQFNIQQFYVLPTQCIYEFWMDLRTNSDYFPININWLIFITERIIPFAILRVVSTRSRRHAPHHCNVYSKTCLKRNLKGPEHFTLKPGFRLIKVHYIQYKKLNQDMQTLNWTEEKNKIITFSLFFPVVKQGFLHAVYSLCCLTFHKHFSLRNYTKHVWIALSYGKFLQFL